MGIIVKMNVDEAEQIASANAKLASASSTMMTAAVVLGILLAVVLGLTVTKVIRGQVGGEPRAAAEAANRVAQGDLNVDIQLAAGDSASMMAAMKTMVQALTGVVADIQRVVVAAGHGDFDQHIETVGTKGYIRDLGTALNQLSETSKTGLNDVIRVMEASAQGILTERITQSYEGDFGRLKGRHQHHPGQAQRHHQRGQPGLQEPARRLRTGERHRPGPQPGRDVNRLPASRRPAPPSRR